MKKYIMLTLIILFINSSLLFSQGFSVTPVFFAWDSIHDEAPISIVSGDDGNADLAPPFTFQYFGENVTNINVTTNGYITLTTASGTRDLNICRADLEAFDFAVRYVVRGVSPNRVLVIEHTDLDYFNNISTTMDLQWIFYENSTIFTFVYNQVDFVNNSNLSIQNGVGSTYYLTPTSGWGQPTITDFNIFGLNSTTESYFYDGCAYTFTPSLTVSATTVASAITTNSASSGGNISNGGLTPVTARGVCWNTSGTPTTADSKTLDGTGTGVFTSILSGLSSNTQYFVRAYGTNTESTEYGPQISFYSLANVPTAPTVDNATSTTVDVDVNTNSNPAITTYAIQETSTGNYLQSNGTLSGVAVWQTDAIWATKTVTGLSQGTTYTFQVKARNGNNTETVFGATSSIMTLGEPILDATTAASSISEGSAVSGGNISNDYGLGVTSRGVCWNTGGNPTTADSKTTDGTGTGVFISNITGLQPNTTYYVRAYATSSGGTGYGAQISFTTLALSVSITNVLKVSDTQYTFTSDLTNPNTITILDKGIVWSTSQNPTTTSNSGSVSSGAGSVQFTDDATGLLVGPGYYVRAYITTANGTFYSEQVHFGVVPTLPEWGLIILAGGFLVTGGWFMFRKFM